ncbi:MAG: hypothetical protein QXS38_00150 [Candidatus Pacearchaeota archaeon]
MSDDYCYPERRKTKSDKRAKARYMRYKKGGAQRSTGIIVSGERKN